MPVKIQSGLGHHINTLSISGDDIKNLCQIFWKIGIKTPYLYNQCTITIQ